MFYKQIIDGFITAIGISDGIGVNETEITVSEYTTIMQKIQNKPSAPENHRYLLRSDLEWVLAESPASDPVEDEACSEDYEQALQQMGVDFND